MDFSTAVSTCFSRYATFSGRAPRAEYWWWTLFIVIGSAVLAMGDRAIFVTDKAGILAPVFSLVTLLPSLAVAVRRLHDIGRSGWWLLIGLIPLIGLIILIVWFTRESDPGDNEFGSDPYGY